MGRSVSLRIAIKRNVLDSSGLGRGGEKQHEVSAQLQSSARGDELDRGVRPVGW